MREVYSFRTRSWSRGTKPLTLRGYPVAEAAGGYLLTAQRLAFCRAQQHLGLGAGKTDRVHREKAGTIERVHDVLKNELAAGVLPSKYFGANAAWLRLAVISYNVLTALKRFGVNPPIIAARPKRLRFSDLLHGRSAGTSRPTDALAAGTEAEGSSCGWKPCDSYRFRPNANIGARAYRRICRAPFGGLSRKNCCPMVYRSALPPAVLAQPQPKGSGSLVPTTNQNSDRVRRLLLPYGRIGGERPAMDFSRLQWYLYGGSGIEKCRTILGTIANWGNVSFSSMQSGIFLQKCRGLSESEGFIV